MTEEIMKNKKLPHQHLTDPASVIASQLEALSDFDLNYVSIMVRDEKTLRDHRDYMIRAIKSNPGAVLEAMGLGSDKGSVAVGLGSSLIS